MFRKILFYIIAALIPVSVYAADPAAKTEMTLEENLMTPEVPEKSKAKIQSYMRKEAESLIKLGYKVESMRKGEIVIVTVGTDKLFAPNDTVIDIANANKLLKPLAAYMRVPERYKILMAVHTDNTGSENYTLSLSEARVHAIYDYFDKIAQNPGELVGYPMGMEEPIATNSSRLGRMENRRVEFYIVPDKELIRSVTKRSR